MAPTIGEWEPAARVEYPRFDRSRATDLFNPATNEWRRPGGGADWAVVDSYLETAPEIRPAPVDPQGRPVTVDAATAPDAEYAALAGALGLSVAVVDRFKMFLSERGLCTYDADQVRVYLNWKYRVPEHNPYTRFVRWGWRPLREVDQNDAATYAGLNGLIQHGAAPYRKPIPYPVLLTVKAIVDAFAGARCFVSDDMQGEAIPDPFLLVVVGGAEFIVERWDEPAFRPK